MLLVIIFQKHVLVCFTFLALLCDWNIISLEGTRSSCPCKKPTLPDASDKKQISRGDRKKKLIRKITEDIFLVYLKLNIWAKIELNKLVCSWNTRCQWQVASEGKCVGVIHHSKIKFQFEKKKQGFFFPLLFFDSLESAFHWW